MIQVKLRDFLRDFTKYRDQPVEVLGKGKVWTWQEKDVRQNEDNLSDKKETADKIVEVIEARPGKLLPNGEYIFDEVSKDSTDNAEVCVNCGNSLLEGEVITCQKCWDVGIKNTKMLQLEKLLEESGIDIVKKEEFVGTCDICSNPSKELWEHEEEGIERNVCRECLRQASWGTPAQFERMMERKKKLGFIQDNFQQKKIPVKFHPTFKPEFNPIPKPVKKEKNTILSRKRSGANREFL